MVFVSTRQQYQKIASIQHQTNVQRIVIMDDAPELTDAVPMRAFCGTRPDRTQNSKTWGGRLGPTTWPRSFTPRGPPARPRA